MVDIIEQHLGPIGSVITFSKPNYRKNHQDNIIIFNCNIIIEGKKVWNGDIDFTILKEELLSLSKEINKEIYLLYEMDSNINKEKIINTHNFAVKVCPNDVIELHKRLSLYYNI